MNEQLPPVAPSGTQPAMSPQPARNAFLLLLAINLFNYIDRYVLAALEKPIRDTFFAPDDPNAKALTGGLATLFLISYMVCAPVFGWLADRVSRWTLIAGGVAVWSLASGSSGLAATFLVLQICRVIVGVGESAYGPAAPTILSDLYPVEKRGRILSFFYLAIPVGSALGYVLGGQVGAHWGWRTAFYLTVIPGLLLAVFCLWQRDPRASQPQEKKRAPSLAAYLSLLRIPSYTLNTAAMTAMTFAIGGISFWMPTYIAETRWKELLPGAAEPSTALLGQINTTFGAISAVGGFLGTITGGWLGDRLRRRWAGGYFLISGAAILCAFPATLMVLHTPFPAAWGWLFLAVFLLFFNTGPANTALANVSPPHIRATAFAFNILIIHALGDAISPPLIGKLAGMESMNFAFTVVAVVMVVASVFWFWGARYLGRDTEEAGKGEK